MWRLNVRMPVSCLDLQNSVSNFDVSPLWGVGPMLQMAKIGPPNLRKRDVSLTTTSIKNQRISEFFDVANSKNHALHFFLACKSDRGDANMFALLACSHRE